MHDQCTLTDEARRNAIEVMACVPWYRRTLVEKILLPAGVPKDVCVRHLNRKDELTGRKVSKRTAGFEILAEMEKRGEGGRFVRAVLEIGARWSDFHEHERPVAARAAAMMAEDFLRKLREMETSHLIHREAQEREERIQRDIEFRRERDILRQQFDYLNHLDDLQERGRLLEDFLNRTFTLFRIRALKPFRRNQGGEQIDGAFRWAGHHFLIECKWTRKGSGMEDVDTLYGKLSRSGSGTMGMFLSINGWSRHVPNLLKQNREKSIILIDGYDLYVPFISGTSLPVILDKKVEALCTRSEPFFSARDLIVSPIKEAE